MRFEEDRTVTEALCAALVRYVGLMTLVAGQDALDGLALVREETLKACQSAGMDESHRHRLEALFIDAARLALKGSGKKLPH